MKFSIDVVQILMLYNLGVQFEYPKVSFIKKLCSLRFKLLTLKATIAIFKKLKSLQKTMIKKQIVK